MCSDLFGARWHRRWVGRQKRGRLWPRLRVRLVVVVPTCSGICDIKKDYWRYPLDMAVAQKLVVDLPVPLRVD